MTGGELLSQLIEAYYLDDSKTARRAGVHVNTIKNMKKGNVEPGPDTVRKVAEVFDRDDDAARLAAAFGYAGLVGRTVADEGEALMQSIVATRDVLRRMEEAYERITGHPA